MKNPILAAILAVSLLSGAGSAAVAGDAWTDPDNPIRALFKGQRLDLWSLRPVKAVDPPAVKNTAWPRGEPDRFILAKLESAGLSPAPEADRAALGRRLYFTLTGLPPSPEELDAFVHDPAPDAFEKLVDRLLASPAFGEHWARLWMDLVRYSDSNGYDWDEFRPNMWRYRDYIVRSLNADKPLDRFIREQLAGDEMVDGPPRDEAERDHLVATGYLRTGPWDNSAKLFNEEHKMRAAMLADLTETTASAFLGLTFACCRCHDHKTDPFSQEDHYRFRAFFGNVRFVDDVKIDLPPEREKIQADHEIKNSVIKEKRKIVDALLKKAGNKENPEKKEGEGLTEEERRELENARAEIARLEKEKLPFTVTLGVAAEAEEVKTFVLAQGDPDQPRGEVSPGVPAIFDPAPRPVRAGHRRGELADWIVSSDNPLTARVLANHVWAACFGQGVVSTPGDFGYSGSPPSHPELLDWLAVYLRENDWSLKRLARLLVTSAAWRQTLWPPEEARRKAEAIDPGNTLLWRMNPRRLTAEQLRDAMLAASGLLQPFPGGPPVWPELPPEVLRANPAFLDDNAERTKGWYPSPPEKLNVRSIYLVQKRSVRLPFMETFDQPDNFMSCARRQVSTVAPQAFTLLNNPIVVPAAQALAERALRESGANPDDLEKPVVRAWKLACGREPSAAELETLKDLRAKTDLPSVCRAIFNSSAFLYPD